MRLLPRSPTPQAAYFIVVLNSQNHDKGTTETAAHSIISCPSLSPVYGPTITLKKMVHMVRQQKTRVLT